MSTRQDLFNRSVAHVLKQGAPSIKVEKLTHTDGASTWCLYRAPDGKGCAAAPFITNYRPEMEHTNFGSVAEKYPDDVDRSAAKDLHFVVHLQSAHDSSANAAVDQKTGDIDNDSFLRLYRNRIRALARDYALALPEGISPERESEE